MELSTTLPLSQTRPVNLRAVKEAGIILPIEPNSPALAVTIWEGEPTALLLEGPQAFTFFKIDITSRFFGLFVPAPEIVVEFDSAARGEALWETLGTLMLDGGRANVVGTRAGDSWSNPVNVPLWQEIDSSWSEEKTIGFSRWALRVMDGQWQRVLWRSPGPELADLVVD